jgi:hypothetical protein
MQDPANNTEAAQKAAARWKQSSKSEELKEQIIATFRLQKDHAVGNASDMGTATIARSQVKRLWAAAFKDDQIPGFDFMNDDGNTF